MITEKTILALFIQLNKTNIKYCVLRNYQSLPFYVNHDIDIFIIEENFSKIKNILVHIKKKFGWLNLYFSHVFPSLISCILFGNLEERNAILHVDFFKSISWHGIDLIQPKEIINNRTFFNDFYIINHTHSSIQQFIQPLLNEGKVREKYKDFIFEKVSSNIDVFKYYLSIIVGPKLTDYIAEKIIHKNFGFSRSDVLKIKKTILFNHLKRNPSYLLVLFQLATRKLKTMLIPTGLFLVFLGPDGSGKGTIIKKFLPYCRKIYIKTKGIHWRPGILPPLSIVFKTRLNTIERVENPHSEEHRKNSSIISFFRWWYYTIDFVIGYYIKILPWKIRETCIIFDRYYYDFLIDPIRYGFNLPRWLFESILSFIPKPDLTIYLDNEPGELYKRKQELPVEELRRQVKEWREVIPSLPNARIVTTDKPLEDVVNEVTRLVLERRAEITRKMLKIDPHESFYLLKSAITDYIAFPSKKNCRWIIPMDPLLAKKSWDLYLPYSLTGRTFKSVMKFLSARGFLKLFKLNKLNLELSDESDALRKCIFNVFKRDDFALALSTGTPGPFRKITAMVISSDGRVLGFAKIGETPLAIERIKNEAKILKLLGNSFQLSGIRSQVSEISFPECLYDGEIGSAYVMIQTPPPFEGESGDSKFNQDYAKVLNILIKNTMVRKKFKDSDFYKNLKQGIEAYPLSYRDILKEGLDYLEKLIGDKEITFGLSHGDFAPWNMLWNHGKVFLFDWESTCLNAPAGIDLMHFLFQTGFLLKKLTGQKLLDFCMGAKSYRLLLNGIKDHIMDSKSLLLIYLIKMAIDEDKPQQLSKSALERRKLIKLLVSI